MAMFDEAQSSSKRCRDDEAQETLMLEDPNSKRQKSFNHILSLLDEDEEESTQDLNSLITTFQQELTNNIPHQIPSDANTDEYEGYNSSSSSESSSSSNSSLLNEEENSVERVMRHLLEASDDELGIPQRDDGGDGFEEEEGFGVGDNGLSLCDGLWELEDEAANYYALVQWRIYSQTSLGTCPSWVWEDYYEVST